MLATVRLLLAAESGKLAAKILELEGRLNAADRAQGPSQYAVVPFKQPGHQRRRAQWVPCYAGLEVDGVTDAVKDPHFSFAHGGRADFRGRNGRERLPWGARPAHSPQLIRNLLSRTGCCTASTLLRALRSTSRLRRPRKPLTALASPPVQPPFPSQDATFKLRKGALTVDGSFITEAHVVAETGRKGKEGELVHATFWANELKCDLPSRPET